jgi:GTP-binding protein Era
MSDVDGVLLVVDSGLNFGPGDDFVIEKIKNVTCPIFIVFNKIDLTDIRKITALKEIYKERIKPINYD